MTPTEQSQPGPFGLHRVPLTPQEEADLTEVLAGVSLEMKSDRWPEVNEDRALRQYNSQQAILQPILEAHGFMVGAPSAMGVGEDGRLAVWANQRQT
jgi:hypothetical protein